MKYRATFLSREDSSLEPIKNIDLESGDEYQIGNTHEDDVNINDPDLREGAGRLKKKGKWVKYANKNIEQPVKILDEYNSSLSFNEELSMDKDNLRLRISDSTEVLLYENGDEKKSKALGNFMNNFSQKER